MSAFSDLQLDLVFATPEDSPRRIMRLLAVLRLWQRAQALGPLAPVRRMKVVSAIEKKIKRLACGSSWAERADRFVRGAGGTIEELQREVGGSPGFASRMRTTSWNWFPNSHRARVEFFRIAKVYGISENFELCELALRLAFHPASIRLNDPKKGAEAFEQLGTMRTLIRGAFFAKLVTDAQTAAPAETIAEAG
jgi:hypothetical protein